MADLTLIDFNDLEPASVEVRVSGKSYTLREATAASAARYSNAILKCTTLGPNGKATSIAGIADTEPLLVSLCLFNSDGSGVTPEVVYGLPARVLAKLYKTVKEISELENDDLESLIKERTELDVKINKLQEAELPVKNEQTGTEDTLALQTG